MHTKILINSYENRKICNHFSVCVNIPAVLQGRDFSDELDRGKQEIKE